MDCPLLSRPRTSWRSWSAWGSRPRSMRGLSSAEVDEGREGLFKLSADGITIIMIEHIMHAVMRFSQRVMCLDAGKTVCEGTPAEVVKNADVQRAYLGA